MPDTDTTAADKAAAADTDAEYVALGPIDLNGARAYNEGSPVSARAVKKHKLTDKQVKKVSK